MSLSDLHFNDDRRRKKNLTRQDFINFVERFLMGRPNDLNIEEFGLVCVDSPRVHQWICKALDHRVKRMTLGFANYELLLDIYTYGSFEVLRLRGGILVDVPNDINFSRLKVLELQSVTISTYESIEKLLHNCPILEDLLIVGCTWLNGSFLNICGSTLKILKLTCDYGLHNENKVKVFIDTPALETLEIGDSIYAKISFKETLLSIRTAHIDVGIEIYELINESVFEILEKICHVKFLTLTDKTISVSVISNLQLKINIFHICCKFV